MKETRRAGWNDRLSVARPSRVAEILLEVGGLTSLVASRRVEINVGHLAENPLLSSQRVETSGNSPHEHEETLSLALTGQCA